MPTGTTNYNALTIDQCVSAALAVGDKRTTLFQGDWVREDIYFTDVGEEVT